MTNPAIPAFPVEDLSGLYDFSGWPIMVARLPGFADFGPDGIHRWISGFDVALARAEPFVVVLDLDAFLKDPREDPEHKKIGAKWLKKNRERYNGLCRGNIYVVSDGDARRLVHGEAISNSRKFAFPFEAVATMDEALRRAGALLDFR